MSGPGDDARLRIEVARGGRPTDEQLAALTVALATASGAPPDDHTADRRTGLTAWQRAALAEGVGARRFAERADLGQPSRAR